MKDHLVFVPFGRIDSVESRRYIQTEGLEETHKPLIQRSMAAVQAYRQKTAEKMWSYLTTLN